MCFPNGICAVICSINNQRYVCKLEMPILLKLKIDSRVSTSPSSYAEASEYGGAVKKGPGVPGLFGVEDLRVSSSCLLCLLLELLVGCHLERSVQSLLWRPYL